MADTDPTIKTEEEQGIHQVDHLTSERDQEVFLQQYVEYYGNLEFASPEFRQAITSLGHLEHLRNDWKSGRLNYFGIRKDNSFISTALLYEVARSHQAVQGSGINDSLEKKGHVGFVTVDAEERKKGLGRKIVKDVMKFAEDQKFEVLEADIYSSNPFGKDSLGTMLGSGFVLDRLEMYEEEGEAVYLIHAYLKNELSIDDKGEKLQLPFDDHSSIQNKIGEGWVGVKVLKKGEQYFIEFAKLKNK